MTQAYFRYYFFTLLAATSVSSPGYSATLIDPSLNAPVVNTEAAVTPASGPYSYKYSQDYPTFVTNVSDRGTNAFASVQDIPIGVTATVNGYGTAAFAQLNYSFELKGPPGTTAPVDVQSFLASVSSPDYAPQQEAEALFSVNSADTHTPLLLKKVCAGKFNCPYFNEVPVSLVNEIISVPTNTVENVTLSAYVYIINGGGSASAHVDPYFAIDPSFADASQYALYFSPGIDNVPISPTPLPAALPMFGAALLAVGGIAWRPQRRTWASGEP